MTSANPGDEMDLNHLHLHVADLEASKQFYARYFQLEERVRHGDVVFLSNAGDAPDRFDLALVADAATALPSWFHFGFRLARPEDVHALHRRMEDEGVRIEQPLEIEPAMVSYRCADPDGYLIEVYWE